MSKAVDEMVEMTEPRIEDTARLYDRLRANAARIHQGPPPDPPRRRRGRKPALSEADRGQIRLIYRQGGVSMSKLAARYGVSYTLIWQVINEAV